MTRMLPWLTTHDAMLRSGGSTVEATDLGFKDPFEAMLEQSMQIYVSSTL